MTAPRVGLTMIVRDEATVITRCLDAAAPWVDFYAIHDTGSVDGTPDLIRARMAAHGIPGTVTHGEFANFAQARNDGLTAARAVAQPGDWLLLCDADMELVVDDPAWRKRLEAAAAFTVMQHTGDPTAGLAYPNLRLLRADAPATYVGATHEYLDVDGPQAHLEGTRFLDHADGGSRGDKFTRDQALLEAALAEHPDDTRTVFYLAQTMRDSGEPAAALDLYQQRAAMGGWDQEVFYSLHRVAVLIEQLSADPVRAADAYLDAHHACPWRAEPLVELARIERDRGRHAVGLLYARAAAALSLPGPEALFVETAAYTWRAWDEVAVNAYWAGHRDEATDAARRALACGPDDPRLQENLRLCATAV